MAFWRIGIFPVICICAPASTACGRTGSELPSLPALGTHSSSSAGSGTGGQNGAAGKGVAAGPVSASGNAGAGGSAGLGGTSQDPVAFIAIHGCRDVAHDSKRERLYLSTATGLARFDFRQRAFLTPLLAGEQLSGLDLSPDQNTLIVADRHYVPADPSTLVRNRIHVVALDDDEIREIEFSDSYYEGGTYMPVFLDDRSALVSASFPGSGTVPLRRVDVEDGSYELLEDTEQDTALVRSADGSVVALAGSNSSGGPFGYYRVVDGVKRLGGTGWFNNTIGVSRNADQYAVPTYFGMFVYDGALKQKAVIGKYAEEYPDAVVYSPVADVMYIAWGSRPAVEAWDVTTLKLLHAIPIGGRKPWSEVAPGKLRLSRDGTQLFIVTYEGVAIEQLDPFGAAPSD